MSGAFGLRVSLHVVHKQSQYSRIRLAASLSVAGELWSCKALNSGWSGPSSTARARPQRALPPGSR